MVGASKILTVSYGTFSCTLEGFDEPFNTMKAIAEYFRDLAADDRYFGAEPPQPDAAMLHRIAEREMNRRVEAKVEDNSVILRASDSALPAATPTPVPAAKATAPVAPLYEDQHGQGGQITESVAAKLSRIRNAVTEARSAGETTRPPKSLAQMMAEASQVEETAATEADALSSAMETPATSDADNGADIGAETVAFDNQLGDNEPLPTPAAAFEPASESEFSVFDDEDLAQNDDANDETLPAPAFLADAADSTAEPEVAEAPVEEEAAIEDLAAAPEAGDDDTLMATLASALAEPQTLPEAEATPIAAPVTQGSDLDITSFLANTQAELDASTQALDDELDAAEVDSLARGLDDLEAQADATLLAADEDEDEALVPTSFGVDFATDESLIDDIPEDTAAVDESDDYLPELEDDITEGEDLEDLRALDAAPVAIENDDAEPVKAQAPDFSDLSSYYAEDQIDTAAFDTGDSDAAPEQMDTPEDDADVAASAFNLASDDVEEDILDSADTEVAPQDEAARDTSDPEDALDAAPDDETEDKNENTLAPAAQDKLQRARARVIKIRRITPQAKVEDAAPVDATASNSDDNAFTNLDNDDMISTEAEADLAAALDPTTELPKTSAPRPDTPERALSRQLPQESDNDESVSRLISQTNTEMEGPENRRRLSAISHLKAAVAATVAERKAVEHDPAKQEQDRIDPYRHDLERAVRPHRAEKPATVTPSRPQSSGTAERPAPLMLVSEQRIDRPSTPKPGPLSGPQATPVAAQTSAPQSPATQVTPVRPVRPRRVAAGNLAMSADEEDDDLDDNGTFTDAADFSEFAEQLGATELSELLEAAAAYAACVEGREHVSRPLLLRRVMDARPDLKDDRETLLRSFGTLLREGRLEKVSKGQFTLDDAAPYMVAARKLQA